MSKINKIKVNGTPYEVEDKEAVKTVTLTQAEYDALQTKDPSIFYVISDGQGGGGGMTSGEVQTMIDSSISGKADTSAVTESIATAVSGKQDTLVSGTNIKTINNESLLGSGNITISGGGSGSSAVEVTQAEYDALVSGGTLDPSVLYIITDAVGGDLSNYMTSAQTMNAISAATSTKQDILSAGTGIDITDNTISVTGGSGGGKAIEGGRGITVTTGATADTVSFNLPLSSSTLTSDSIVGGYYANSSMAQYGFAFGENAKCGNSGSACIALGRNVTANGSGAIALGSDNTAKGKSVAIGQKVNSNLEGEIALGIYNVSSTASTTFGDSGNTLFSVGNGTANNARHNAFEIRQNGDIYITSGSTDIKLQDHLGGGGITSGEVQDMIDTSISGKQDTLSAGTNITITNNVISAQLEGGTVSRGDVEDMIEEATSGLQETLSAGTGIEISGNVISATGGGATYSAGTNISIDSANTISCTLPISAYTASSNKLNLTVFGTQNTISNNLSDANFIVGNDNKVGNGFDGSLNNYIFGSNNSLDKGYQNRHSHGNFVAGNYNKLGENLGEAVSTCKIFGNHLNPKNNKEILFGQYNNSVSESTTFGDSGNTLFSVGNGTADNARHNAFEIRQNGDIYITSGSTDIKLQDHLGGGGGGTYSAGTNISIDSANTISCTLPISAGTNSNGKGIIVGDSECSAKGTYAISFGHNSDAGGGYSLCCGSNSSSNGRMSLAFGDNCNTDADFSYIFGRNIRTTKSNQFFAGNHLYPKNEYEVGFGQYNNTVSASTTFGDSGNTLFSIGNGYDYSSTHNHHNAIEIRQNGDIYVPNTDDSSISSDKAYSLYPMVRLQDTITATTANTTALGGMKIVKLTESEYTALVTKDDSTLYVVVPDPSN